MLKKQLFYLTLVCFSCTTNIKDADEIINKSIEVSGGEFIAHSIIQFDFRDKHYKAKREDGIYQFERMFKDSIGTVHDVLNNNGFKRLVDSQRIEISNVKEKAYTSSVNSVHYFSVLPFGLHDKAVNKSYVGNIEIKGKLYLKIHVSFNEEGGGEDFDDKFIYWVNAQNYKVDYLAYSYSENSGKGFRFREAYNERYIKGIRFVDYKNFKPQEENIVFENMDNLYLNNKLELLSVIELKNINVDSLAIQ